MSILSFFIEAVHIFKSHFKLLDDGIIIDYIFQLINPNQKNIISSAHFITKSKFLPNVFSSFNLILIHNSIYDSIKKIITENDEPNKEI